MKDDVCALTPHLGCIRYELVPVPILNSNTQQLVMNESLFLSELSKERNIHVCNTMLVHSNMKRK